MAAVYDDQESLAVSQAGLRMVEMLGEEFQKVEARAFEDLQEDSGKFRSVIHLKIHWIRSKDVGLAFISFMLFKTDNQIHTSRLDGSEILA